MLSRTRRLFLFTTMAKESKPKAAAAEAAAPDLVTVRVLVGAVGELQGTFEKGEIFQTTAQRAAELGNSVEIVK